MKIDYRKVIGILLLGVACLVSGCQSLLSGFKKSTFRSDCRWIEVPYHFQCDYFVTGEVVRAKDPSEATGSMILPPIQDFPEEPFE